MKRVLSFGGYSFDQNTQGQFSDNFTNGVPRTVRLPGLPGAFDELGLEPSPSEIGNLKLMFYVMAETREAITRRRDDIRAMTGWGVRKLVVQPADQSLSPRYTYARIQNIQMSENAKTPDKVQAVTIDWQVSYPRWMQDSAPRITWGGGKTWGQAGAIWGDSNGTNLVGSARVPPSPWGGAVWGNPNAIWGGSDRTTLTYTNRGNAISQPRVLFTCSDTANEGLVIERFEGGIVQESLSYTGVIPAGQVLDFDCPALCVELNGSPAYDLLDYTHPAWLRLAPGANTLRVSLPSGGGTLRVIYPHTWY